MMIASLVFSKETYAIHLLQLHVDFDMHEC